MQTKSVSSKLCLHNQELINIYSQIKKKVQKLLQGRDAFRRYIFVIQLFEVLHFSMVNMFESLFGLSFWRHLFTAEDPLVSKWL